MVTSDHLRECQQCQTIGNLNSWELSFCPNGDEPIVVARRDNVVEAGLGKGLSEELYVAQSVALFRGLVSQEEVKGADRSWGEMNQFFEDSPEWESMQLVKKQPIRKGYLQRLLVHPNPWVRRGLSCRRDLPREWMAVLAQDPDEKVADELASRDDLPDSVAFDLLRRFSSRGGYSRLVERPWPADVQFAGFGSVNKTGAPSDAALVAEVRGFQKRGREKTSQPGWEAGKQWISRFHVENYPQYDTVEKFIGWQEAGQEEWHFLGWQMDNDGTYLFQVTAKIPHESHGMVRLFSHTGRGIVVMGKVKDLEGETATWMSVGTPERVTPSLFRFPENLDGNDEVLEQGEKMRLLGHLLLGGWRMGPPLLLGVWGNNGKAVFGNLENHFMQVDPEAIGLQGPRPITRALASKIAQRQQFLRQVGAQGLGL